MNCTDANWNRAIPTSRWFYSATAPCRRQISTRPKPDARSRTERFRGSWSGLSRRSERGRYDQALLRDQVWSRLRTRLYPRQRQHELAATVTGRLQLQPSAEIGRQAPTKCEAEANSGSRVGRLVDRLREGLKEPLAAGGRDA